MKKKFFSQVFFSQIPLWIWAWVKGDDRIFCQISEQKVLTSQADTYNYFDPNILSLGRFSHLRQARLPLLRGWGLWVSNLELGMTPSSSPHPTPLPIQCPYAHIFHLRSSTLCSDRTACISFINLLTKKTKLRLQPKSKWLSTLVFAIGNLSLSNVSLVQFENYYLHL